MKTIKRIAIIGNAGSGKSTLAVQLNKILNLPVYHLDQYFWNPNWIRRDPEEYEKMHDQICNEENWIIDGVNLRVLEYRIQRADVIIFLDYPRYLCFYRVIKRLFKYYGKEHSSSPKGCPERLCWASIPFLKWIWNFKFKYNPRINEFFNKYKHKKLFIIKSKDDIAKLIENLDK